MAFIVLGFLVVLYVATMLFVRLDPWKSDYADYTEIYSNSGVVDEESIYQKFWDDDTPVHPLQIQCQALEEENAILREQIVLSKTSYR